jgi:hypothetical protein
MRKRAAVSGFTVTTIYRVLLVTAIAFVVLGLGASSYKYNLDVRDSEAAIMSRVVYDCLAPDGVLDVSKIDEGERTSLLDYCGIYNNERFYVGVFVLDSNEEEIYSFSQGRKDDLWIRTFYENAKPDDWRSAKVPGYYFFEAPVDVRIGSGEVSRELNIEVLVKDE